MAKLELSISEDYVNHWGKWEGVRDVAQNVRDAVVMLGAEQDVSYKPETKTLVLASRGAAIDSRSLLLGRSTKRDRPDAAGQYGEGMKLAYLALIRAGCDVKVRTGDELWVPRIERSEKFNGERVLVIQTRKIPVRQEVETTIVGIEPDEWERFQKRLLFLTPPEFAIEVPGMGSLLLDEEYKGKIFSHGIYVQDVANMSYGYDLQNVKVDRDRSMAASWDVSYESTQLLAKAMRGAPDLQRGFYKAAVAGHVDGTGISLQYGHEETLAALIREFDAEHGEGTIAVATEEQARELRYLGLSAVVVNQTLRQGIEIKRGTYLTARKQRMEHPKETFQRADLTDVEKLNLVNAERSMEEIAEPVTTDVVTFHHEATLARNNTATGQIWIARPVLASEGRTLMCLVHERAHFNSKAGDGDPRHTGEIERLWLKLWEKAGG